MGGMDMPGGWSMSMTWMRMPGQSWPGAALMFIGMWSVMMVAMMLPVLTAELWRQRRSARAARARVAWPALQTACAYYSAWILSGVVAYPFGAALAQTAMREPTLARAVPMLAGACMTLAAILQLSAWKRRQLGGCRHPTDGAATGAWRDGWRLGWRCIRCCAPLTGMLFIVGVMEPAAMGVATLAIAAERLLPAGVRAARFSGAAMLLGGMIMLARASAA
jgi:predicted metal-binding membrane protein